MSGITFNKQPDAVGFWKLSYGNETSFTQFAMYARPTDQQIKNTEELLGWTWVEAQEK
jgi:hypothetical protein